MSIGEIVDFDDLDANERTLVREAVAAMDFAYCPYSNFAVGAAISVAAPSGDGAAPPLIFRGCNVESCSYTPTICAERTAVCKLVSEGHRKIGGVAVAARQDAYTSPCGVCRQVLIEFGDRATPVLMTKPDMRRVLRAPLGDLLPMPFVGVES